MRRQPKIKSYELPSGALAFAVHRVYEPALYALTQAKAITGSLPGTADGFSTALASAYYQGLFDAIQLVEDRGAEALVGKRG